MLKWTKNTIEWEYKMTLFKNKKDLKDFINYWFKPHGKENAFSCDETRKIANEILGSSSSISVAMYKLQLRLNKEHDYLIYLKDRVKLDHDNYIVDYFEVADLIHNLGTVLEMMNRTNE